MFEIFLALIFAGSIFLNVFLFIEKQEINEEIIKYINQIQETRTRAINLLKTKIQDDKENKEIIESMKEIWKENRLAKKIYKHLFPTLSQKK